MTIAKKVSVPVKKIEFSSNEEQSDLKKVTLEMLCTGLVPSHSLYMESTSLEAMKESLDLKPILCAYEEDDEGKKVDFLGHEIEYEYEQNGNTITITKTYIEQPVGVLVGNTAKTFTRDGQEWVSCDGYLYNEYCGDAVRILEESDGDKSVSIEFEITDGFDNKKVFHVTDMHFFGVTLLGDDHPPAISGANCKVMEFEATEHRKTLFTKQLNTIIESVSKLKEEEVHMNELLEKYKHLSEKEEYKTIVENIELSIEEKEIQLLSLSESTKRKAIDEVLEGFTYDYTYSWGETVTYRKYYTEDILTEESIAIVYDYEVSKFFGVPYKFEGDKAVLNFEEIARYTRGDWRAYIEGSTGEESNLGIQFGDVENQKFEKLEEKITEIQEVKSKLEEEIGTLKASFSDLQGEKTALEQEVVELREFKGNVIEAEKQAELSELLGKYSELSKFEGYNEVIESNKENLVELEKSLKILAFDNGVVLGKSKQTTFSKPAKGAVIVQQVQDTAQLSEAEKRYGIDISKYKIYTPKE